MVIRSRVSSVGAWTLSRRQFRMWRGENEAPGGASGYSWPLLYPREGRFIGTLLGVLLATGLVWWLHPTQTVMSWWSLVGAFLAFALFPTGYAAFSAAITLYVVFAISASGAAEGVVVEVRLALTLLGGLLALVFYLEGVREGVEILCSYYVNYIFKADGRLLKPHSPFGVWIFLGRF